MIRPPSGGPTKKPNWGDMAISPCACPSEPAGIALNPAPFKGIPRLERSELKATGPALNHPGGRHATVALNFDQFNYAFTNT